MGTRDNVTHNVIPPAGPARHVPSPVGRLPATLAAAREATYCKATSRLAAAGADARAPRAHVNMHMEALSLSPRGCAGAGLRVWVT